MLLNTMALHEGKRWGYSLCLDLGKGSIPIVCTPLSRLSGQAMSGSNHIAAVIESHAFLDST